jgi:hypothetical protein
VRGEDEHLDGCGVLVPAELAQDLPAVQAGQTDVEDDGIGRIGSHGLEALHTVAGRRHGDPEHPEAHLDEAPNGRRVLDDEYTLFHVGVIGRNPL